MPSIWTTRESVQILPHTMGMWASAITEFSTGRVTRSINVEVVGGDSPPNGPSIDGRPIYWFGTASATAKGVKFGMPRSLSQPRGLIGAVPLSISPNGTFVMGYAYVHSSSSTPVSVAIMWKGGKPIVLSSLFPHSPQWQLLGATGVNNRGEMVGTGLFKGRTTGFLLKPPARGRGSP
jgi:hypothetical protein